MRLPRKESSQKYPNLALVALVAATGLTATVLMPAERVFTQAQRNSLIPLPTAAAKGSMRNFVPIIGVRQLAAQGIRITVRDTATLENRIMRHYAGVNVHADPHRPIPDVFIDRLPRDFAQSMPVQKRKQLFVQSVLPLILLANTRIEHIRARLQSIANRTTINTKDQAWIGALSERYGLNKAEAPYRKIGSNAAEKLLLYIDVIPVSLALSQAAAESGWGRSRFARDGNALFGQWTEDSDRGLLPLDRAPDKRHFVRAFPDLLASVDSYMRNLNSHPAYHDFRVARAITRLKKQPLNSLFLAGYLDAYSERGSVYTEELRTIIRVNKFNVLDNSQLRSQTTI